MDTDISHESESYDDYNDKDLKNNENDNENNDDNKDDLMADDELFDNDIKDEDEEIQSEKINNEVETKNNDITEIDKGNENSNNVENTNMKEDQLNNDNSMSSQPVGIKNSKENIMDNEKEDTSHSNKTYEREVDIDEGEIVMKPLNEIKKEEYNSVGGSNTLKGSKKSLYGSGYFGSNPQIARSNKELYKNIVQKRYTLGNKGYESKPHAAITEEIVTSDIEEQKINKDQCNSTSKDSVHQESMESEVVYDKREKVKYTESNMVDINPVNLDDLTDDSIAKKSDRWLCPSYLNNENIKRILRLI